MSQKNTEGITRKPTKKSATASETINALAFTGAPHDVQPLPFYIPFLSEKIPFSAYAPSIDK